MQAGKLNHRITIEERTTAKDAAGGVLDQWSSKGTIWAAVEPLSGRELMAAKAVMAEAEVKITIRYPGYEVTPEMRISYGAHVYDIQNVSNVAMRNQWLEILAKERL